MIAEISDADIRDRHEQGLRILRYIPALRHRVGFETSIDGMTLTSVIMRTMLISSMAVGYPFCKEAILVGGGFGRSVQHISNPHFGRLLLVLAFNVKT
jgi:hypothetical protein